MEEHCDDQVWVAKRAFALPFRASSCWRTIGGAICVPRQNDLAPPRSGFTYNTVVHLATVQLSKRPTSRTHYVDAPQITVVISLWL